MLSQSAHKKHCEQRNKGDVVAAVWGCVEQEMPQKTLINHSTHGKLTAQQKRCALKQKANKGWRRRVGSAQAVHKRIHAVGDNTSKSTADKRL
jgi:hypothetical protein